MPCIASAASFGPQDFFIRTDQDDAVGQPYNDLLKLPVIATRLLHDLLSVGPPATASLPKRHLRHACSPSVSSTPSRRIACRQNA
jgi:hypothetical protein